MFSVASVKSFTSPFLVFCSFSFSHLSGCTFNKRFLWHLTLFLWCFCIVFFPPVNSRLYETSNMHIERKMTTFTTSLIWRHAHWSFCFLFTLTDACKHHFDYLHSINNVLFLYLFLLWHFSVLRNEASNNHWNILNSKTCYVWNRLIR